MSVPTTERLALELAVNPLAIARYTDAELVCCAGRILSKPGMLTAEDAEEIAIIGQAFILRERLQEKLRAQMN